LQGQLTLALTQNGWQGESDQPFGLLLLLDTKDKSDQLKQHLADLQKKWADAGKTVKIEKIRNLEFSVLPLSSNDMPKTLRRFFPPAQEVQELGAETPKKSPAPTKTELVVGQVESLLIVGNSTKVVEPVVARLTGGALPALGDAATYQANHQALFRESPCYGWVNVKAFIDTLSRKAAEKKENPEAPNPFDIKPEKFISALGLAGLKTAAVTYRASNEGALLQLFLGAPEANRQGLFKILAAEAKEANPPPFVPADAVKFRRWRIDGKKAWATLEKTLSDISPQWLAGVNFLIDTANLAAKEKDPGFDVRKNLIGNLGDDIITYEKAPRGTSQAELQAPPSLALIGSSNPEQMAAALKSILIFLGQQAGNPTEREFLGRKIFSLPLPALPLPMATSAKPGADRTLSYAASGGYLALSTDAAMLEEYLRTTETQPKALRETAGLAEAAQQVTGPGTGLFGYENQLETMRAAFEALRKDPKTANASSAASLLPASLNVAGSDQTFKEWMDFSLLPGFEKIAKYFHFTVYGGNATTEGLTFKLFAPVPPGLKSSEPAK
ncbi:MAG TPA: hypothetical protein VNT26_12770, partial [Candidatus Sulfotelmatobacter sp.]|nr:hypothetical protein [Candidatus Sulfotelmatobacter sp.]